MLYRIRNPIEQEFDYITFTSPSNVEGYLKENIIPQQSKIIAWGETTKIYLLANRLEVYKTLKISSENEIIEILTSE